MSKHTPGPWTAVANPTCYEWEIRRDEDDPGTYLATVIGREDTSDTDEANARLIAAAPDLLLQLQRLERIARDTIDADGALIAACDNALAAIAKAEGN